MSVLELESLARKHWRKYLPEKVKDLRAAGQFEEAVHGAALLAQHQRELEREYRKNPPPISDVKPKQAPRVSRSRRVPFIDDRNGELERDEVGGRRPFRWALIR